MAYIMHKKISGKTYYYAVLFELGGVASYLSIARQTGIVELFFRDPERTINLPAFLGSDGYDPGGEDRSRLAGDTKWGSFIKPD